MEVDRERRGSFLEWLPEKIDSANDHGQGLGNSFAAPALGAELVRAHFGIRSASLRARE